jgi:hypothetical protein
MSAATLWGRQAYTLFSCVRLTPDASYIRGGQAYTLYLVWLNVRASHDLSVQVSRRDEGRDSLVGTGRGT